jgi:hypothetical protein
VTDGVVVAVRPDLAGSAEGLKDNGKATILRLWCERITGSRRHDATNWEDGLEPGIAGRGDITA